MKVEASRGLALLGKGQVANEQLNDFALLLVKPFFACMIGQDVNYHHVVKVHGTHLSSFSNVVPL